MTLEVFTPAEKLNEVERLIRFRRSRGEDSAVLRAIASDLRVQVDEEKPTEALVAIDQRISAVRNSKTGLGYEQRKLIALAQEVIGRWPVIRAGLVLLSCREDA